MEDSVSRLAKNANKLISCVADVSDFDSRHVICSSKRLLNSVCRNSGRFSRGTKDSFDLDNGEDFVDFSNKRRCDETDSLNNRVELESSAVCTDKKPRSTVFISKDLICVVITNSSSSMVVPSSKRVI